MMPTLKHLESEARKAQLGFWSNPAYDIKTPETIDSFTNSFQIVDGTIIEVAAKADTIYFDFGKDWKTDFTIKVLRKNWNRFAVNGIAADPALWRGRRVRIRGWVEYSNGAMIELVYPEQIDLFAKAQTDAPAPKVP